MESPGNSAGTGVSLSRMDRYFPFLSRCPRCGYEWLQDGYTRGALLECLRSRLKIEAYCMRCAALWPISAEEQQAISAELAG